MRESCEIYFGVSALGLGILLCLSVTPVSCSQKCTLLLSGGISYNSFLMENLKLTNTEFAENHVLNIYSSALFLPWSF